MPTENTNTAPVRSTTQLANPFHNPEYVQPDIWLPVTQWPYPWPTPGSWRAMIFAAQPRESSRGRIAGNGLIEAGVIRRVGRRVVVNPRAFAAWIQQRGVA